MKGDQSWRFIDSDLQCRPICPKDTGTLFYLRNACFIHSYHRLLDKASLRTHWWCDVGIQKSINQLIFLQSSVYDMAFHWAGVLYHGIENGVYTKYIEFIFYIDTHLTSISSKFIKYMPMYSHNLLNFKMNYEIFFIFELAYVSLIKMYL